MTLCVRRVCVKESSLWPVFTVNCRVSCSCCLTCSSRFLPGAIGLIGLFSFRDSKNPFVQPAEVDTCLTGWKPHFVCVSFQQRPIGKRHVNAIFFHNKVTVKKTGSQVTCPTIRATYLFSCPGSSCPPRSTWSASRSGRPGVFYFRPTGSTPASGPPPSGRALQPRRHFLTFLRKTQMIALDTHNYRSRFPETAADLLADIADISHRRTGSFIWCGKVPLNEPEYPSFRDTFRSLFPTRDEDTACLALLAYSKHVFLPSPSLVTPAVFAFRTAHWLAVVYLRVRPV